VLQEEEKLEAVSQYDLGLKPKLRKSDRKKSLSMPNVLSVKPVESAGSNGSNKTIPIAFDSPKAPIKKKFDGQIITIKRFEDVVGLTNRLQKFDARNIGRKKVRKLKFNSNRIAQLITEINFLLDICSCPPKYISSGTSCSLLTKHQAFG
jgi:hypothetical protein